jgi:hypothetical protein
LGSIVFISDIFLLIVDSGISFFEQGKFDTLTLWKRDGWALTITDDKNVSSTGSENLSSGILDVSDVERTWMLLNGLHNTNSTNVVSSGKVHSSIVLELDYAGDLVGGQVNLERIPLLDVWMWESEGSSIMGGNKWDLLLANVLLYHLAELEACLLGVNSVWIESSLSVKEHSEELVGFFNSNNVHLTKWESVVSSDSSINLDQAFFLPANLNGFLSSHGVPQPLLQQNAQWDALSQLVWTWRGSSTVHTS